VKAQIIPIAAALLLTLSLSAQKQTDKASGTAVASGKLVTAADTLQYSLGVFVGQWMINNGFAVSNKDFFNQGMEDILQNKPRMITDSTIVPIIAKAQLSTQNERNRLLEEQLFNSLRGQTGIGILPNGVNYRIIKQGIGIRPTLADTITVNVVGTFPDGTSFEDTYKKQQPVIIQVSGLIPGLAEAIQLMPAGSVWRIWIPSALGYGPVGLQGVIPPNMALVFDISLEGIR
jgi:FKBP-type peptidyl-prolyl cis-trans isomerase